MSKDILNMKIEELKELLNYMIASKSFSYSEILRVSQELDLLIVEYYRSA